MFLLTNFFKIKIKFIINFIIKTFIIYIFLDLFFKKN